MIISGRSGRELSICLLSTHQCFTLGPIYVFKNLIVCLLLLLVVFMQLLWFQTLSRHFEALPFSCYEEHSSTYHGLRSHNWKNYSLYYDCFSQRGQIFFNLSATQMFKVIINREERMQRKCISKINLVIEQFTMPYNLLISIATAKFMFA